MVAHTRNPSTREALSLKTKIIINGSRFQESKRSLTHMHLATCTKCQAKIDRTKKKQTKPILDGDFFPSISNWQIKQAQLRRDRGGQKTIINQLYLLWRNICANSSLFKLNGTLTLNTVHILDHKHILTCTVRQ